MVLIPLRVPKSCQLLVDTPKALVPRDAIVMLLTNFPKGIKSCDWMILVTKVYD